MSPITLATGAAFLLGCNIDLSGANLNANVKADIKADVTNSGNVNVGNNTTINNPGGPVSGGGPGGPGGPSGPGALKDVIGISLSTSTTTLLAGAIGPFEPEPNPNCCQPWSGQGPQPYATPAAVGSPIPVRSSIAKIEVMAQIRNMSQPVGVSPDDPGFSFEISPNVPYNFDPRQRILWAVKETPPGELTLTVRWGSISQSLKFQVVSGGAADVVAE
jgi:hypothetical protein